MGTGATATVTQEQYQEMVSNNVFSSDYWLEILGKIVKFLALVIVGVMAAVFFFNAFDFDAKKIMSKVVTKKVKKEGGKDGGE
jgi:cbb3-type cytochrome oxidase subunit 1